MMQVLSQSGISVESAQSHAAYLCYAEELLTGFVTLAEFECQF